MLQRVIRWFKRGFGEEINYFCRVLGMKSLNGRYKVSMTASLNNKLRKIHKIIK